MKYEPISIRRFSLRWLVGQQVLLDLLEAVQEEVAGLLVAVVELAHHVAEQEVDFRLGERHQPRQDSLDPLSAGRLERPDDDPAVGGLEHDAGALGSSAGRGGLLGPRRQLFMMVQVTCTWRKVARVLSSSFISPRDSRKARVDSAPWFTLTRSSWRPSWQPPVLGS